MTRPSRLPGLLSLLLAPLLLPAPALADRLDDLAAEIMQLREELEQNKIDDANSGVRINGYYSFDIITDSGAGRSTFRQHSFNLFVGREWDRWQVLSEIEYEDGVTVKEGTPNPDVTGAVALEYAWFQYQVNDAFKVRGGKFLVPEYWNAHHFAPVTMSTAPPLLVKKVFPDDATGLMLHGATYVGKVGATYSTWVTNGDSHAATDTSDHKGGGGKLTLNLGGLFSTTGRLDLSFFGHHTLRDYPPPAPLTPTQPVDITGLELQINTRLLELLAEYVHQDGASGPEGFYVQPAVRVSKGVRLFYRYEGLDRGLVTGTDGGMPIRHTGGINWRPQPNMTVKLEGNNTRYDVPAGTTVQQLLASVALFF
ncbi:MAG: hypothetical protein OEY97_02605 [Nitrospirota bacterium]|nr:hypothetical protein [Nitrospirota bacterium]